MLCASVFIAHGELPYNEGDEQPCSGRQGTDIGEPMNPDQVMDEFTKSFIGMTFGQMKSNSQVDSCNSPSNCASLWSRIGAKRLRDAYHLYRAKGLEDRAEALGRFYNTLIAYKYMGISQAFNALRRGWDKLPLTSVREELRRKFCAFRILDENGAFVRWFPN
ncbi:hypothetical protein COOONC_20580 [Cooperia oncophora]